MINSKIAAGIVLYNSEIERLRENINAVKTQVDQIIFFDNNSKNIKNDFINTQPVYDIKEITKDYIVKNFEID